MFKRLDGFISVICIDCDPICTTSTFLGKGEGEKHQSVINKLAIALMKNN